MFLFAAMSSVPIDSDFNSDDDNNDVINISEEDMGHGDDYILSALAELENAEISEDDDQSGSDLDEPDFLLATIDDDQEEGDDAFVMEVDPDSPPAAIIEKPEKSRSPKDRDDLHKELRESIYNKLSAEYEGRLKASENHVRELKNDVRTARSLSDEKIKEAKEFQDKWVRVSADYQNFQKRSRSKLGEFVELEKLKVLREIVPVFENLKRSLEYIGDVEGLVEGVKLIYKQFNEVLERMGVKEIVAENQPFDPHYHEALHRMENTELPNNTIIEVLSMGFYINDRVLRPSKVVVSFNPTDKMEPKSEGPREDFNETDRSASESEVLQETSENESGGSSAAETADDYSVDTGAMETHGEINGGKIKGNSVHINGSSQDMDKENPTNSEIEDENTVDTDV